MYNGPIFFDEKGNAIIMQPVIIPKGLLKHYLKWQDAGGWDNKNNLRKEDKSYEPS